MALRHRFIHIVLPLLEWRHVRSINNLLVSLHSWITCRYWIHNQSASQQNQTFTTFWNYTQILPFFLSHSNSFFVYLILAPPQELFESGHLVQQLPTLDAALVAAEQRLKTERSNEGWSTVWTDLWNISSRYFKIKLCSMLLAMALKKSSTCFGFHLSVVYFKNRSQSARNWREVDHSPCSNC